MLSVLTSVVDAAIAVISPHRFCRQKACGKTAGVRAQFEDWLLSSQQYGFFTAT
jgi:hypothetical protein